MAGNTQIVLISVMNSLEDVQLLALPKKTEREKEEEIKKGGNPNVCEDSEYGR